MPHKKIPNCFMRKYSKRKLDYIRSSRPEVFCQKCVLRNFAKFTRKQGTESLFQFSFIKKETLTQVFSYEFCEISKNTSFHRTPLVAASVICIHELKIY